MNVSNLDFKNMSFTLYNMIDDDAFVMECERDSGELYGIDDFEWAYIDMPKKEKFLIKMHNKEMLNLIEDLKKKITETEKAFKIYTRFDTGNLIIIKLKKAVLPDIELKFPSRKEEEEENLVDKESEE